MDSLAWEIVQLILVQCDPVPVRFVCRQWRDLIPYKEFDHDYCARAAQEGHLECLKWAHENGCPLDWWTCVLAAKNGHLECLKYARENGCPWNEETCAYAALNGHLQILQWARENGCPWDEETCALAAKN